MTMTKKQTHRLVWLWLGFFGFFWLLGACPAPLPSTEFPDASEASIRIEPSPEGKSETPKEAIDASDGAIKDQEPTGDQESDGGIVKLPEKPSPEKVIQKEEPPVFDDDICAGKRPCVSTYAGSPYDLKGPLAHPWFLGPIALATDGTNYIYLSDFRQPYIFQIDLLKKQVELIVGGPESGYKDGLGLQAKIDKVCALTLDSKGDLYFSDKDNLVIRKYDTTTKTVSTVVGTGKSGTTDGPALQASFESPCGLAFDSKGELYISDKATIRKWNRQTGMVSTIAGSGTLGTKDGPAKQAQLYYPRSLAFNTKGELYFTEYVELLIRKLDTKGVITTLHGTIPSFKREGAGLALTFDKQDNLYFPTPFEGSIKKLDTTGKVTLFLGTGKEGYKDGPINQAQFYSIHGMVFDTVGNIYIADAGNSRIRKLDTKGQVTTYAGGPEIEGFRDGPAHLAKFDVPESIAFDKDDNLYIIEEGNNTLRKIDSQYRRVTTILRQKYGRGLVFDPQNRLMVTALANIVQVRDSGSITIFSGGSGQDIIDGPAQTAQYYAPGGITVDSQGNFYVVDLFYVRQVSPNGTVKTLGDGRVIGADFLLGPKGLARDSKGNIYIAEYSRHYIVKMTPDGVFSTYAGKQHDNGYKDGPRLDARFTAPCDITIDKNDNLYISEGGAIRKIDTNGIVSTIVGTANVRGFRNGEGKDVLIYGACGLAFDSKGALYVADRFNHRIRKILLK